MYKNYYLLHVNTLIGKAERVSDQLIDRVDIGHTPDPPPRKNSSVLHKSHGSVWPRLGSNCPLQPPPPVATLMLTGSSE